MEWMTRPLRFPGITPVQRYYGAVRAWTAHRYFRPHGSPLVPFTLSSPTRVSSSEQKPGLESRLLHTGHRMDSKQVSSMPLPKLGHHSGFDVIFGFSMLHRRFAYARLRPPPHCGSSCLYPMHDDGELACQRHLGFLYAAPPGDLRRPALQGMSGGAITTANRECRTHLSLDKRCPLLRAVQIRGCIAANLFWRTATSIFPGFEFSTGTALAAGLLPVRRNRMQTVHA
jgi:hypothetical protein